jgi:hypothetical protein
MHSIAKQTPSYIFQSDDLQQPRSTVSVHKVCIAVVQLFKEQGEKTVGFSWLRRTELLSGGCGLKGRPDQQRPALPLLPCCLVHFVTAHHEIEGGKAANESGAAVGATADAAGPSSAHT